MDSTDLLPIGFVLFFSGFALMKLRRPVARWRQQLGALLVLASVATAGVCLAVEGDPCDKYEGPSRVACEEYERERDRRF